MKKWKQVLSQFIAVFVVLMAVMVLVFSLMSLSLPTTSIMNLSATLSLIISILTVTYVNIIEWKKKKEMEEEYAKKESD